MRLVFGLATSPGFAQDQNEWPWVSHIALTP
jgi:hypothetical protein